ncbi:MAG: hypothetical protein KDA98_11985 [Acidimicrobiales bacterium]|nr:hypothetical protein [Acidimicrobiales bacterium]
MPSTKTTAQAFDEFDENLKLDPRERARAEVTHREITALLTLKGVIVSAFLQGSFARKTMIAPLRDIDKVVVLHPDLRGLSPDEVMSRIESVLRVAYPKATFDRSRHALQMDFGKESFYFDTVPAWEGTGSDDDVMIANRDSGGWDRSNTRTLIRVVSDRNQATGGAWIHQVRMAKQVGKHLLDGVVPGLHIESWAYIAVAGALPHDEALARILEHGATLIGGRYTEPTGVEVISDRLKPDVVAMAKPVLQSAATRAREARRLADAGDHNEAIGIWHQLCGDCFPEAEIQDASSALGRSFHAGSITSSGTVASSNAGAQRSQPMRSWRLR